MSVKATTAVWEQSQATGPARLVLLAIADHADPDGVAWPSVGRLARMCRLKTHRAVQKHLLILEQLGELHRGLNEGRHGTNVYKILLDMSENFKKKGVQEPPSESTPRPNRHPVHTGSLPPSESTPTPVRIDTLPPSESTPEPPRTTKNREGEPAGASLALDQAPPPLSDLEFCLEALQELFPRSVWPMPARELELLGEWVPAMVEFSPEDFEAMTCWFIHADDDARGRKKWPRDRREFLVEFTEAMEKIREWWEVKGREWWSRKMRAKVRSLKEEEPAGELPENWKEILNS